MRYCRKDRWKSRSDGKTKKKTWEATGWTKRKEIKLQIGRESTKSHSVENALRQRLWTDNRLKDEWISQSTSLRFSVYFVSESWTKCWSSSYFEMYHRSSNFAIHHTVSPSLKILGYNNMEKERAVKTNSLSDITKLNKHTSHFTT